MFGITCAPELFQKIMEQILSGCEGCFNFIDDIIVYGADKEEHDKRLAAVLETLSKNEVTLNQEKCIYGVSKLKFLGHNLSADGITPDSDKLESIRKFREPTTGEEVRSFLGLVNYVGKFIPNLATSTDPLRILTKKGQTFKWGKEQREAFDDLKKSMSDTITLGYYDVDDRTQLIADASPVGLGAVLIQINAQGPRIISYASKSLSEAEKRYAQTEKEALALVWAAERFHFYLYGRQFELVTDHKPLEIIFSPKSKPCARIERWVLRLQSYKYKVIYRSGKSNIADPLSRLVVTDQENPEPFDERAEHYVHWVVSNATPIAMKLSEIEKCSMHDETIQAVKVGIYEDVWTEIAMAYKIFATELCFSGGILLRNSRIVMPEKLRMQTLDLAHEGHPGMTVMKRRVRAKVWWPKLDVQVEAYVKQCRGCMLVAAPAAPEPMKRKELPSEPWQHLAIDFMGPLPSGHYLLVIVDYYSRFVEIEIMKKTDSGTTIERLRPIFARFGFPISITADNGSQFTSDEFKNYCKECGIQLISTIPYWPQQNGEVERQNRSILKRLIISQNTGRNWVNDLNDYLLMYRTTQHSTTLKTPAELLFNGRNVRDKLPSMSQPLEIDQETADRDKEKKEREKQYADERRHAKESEIQAGDEVLVKRMQKTNKLSTTFVPDVHKVVERKGSETVIKDVSSGAMYRRNVSHLQKIHKDDVPKGSADPDHTAVDTKDTAASFSEPRPKRATRKPDYLRYFDTK